MLYGARIPEGFDLMAEVIARVKSGGFASAAGRLGLVHHQLWSLDPLVRLEITGRSCHKPTTVQKHLRELFKALCPTRGRTSAANSHRRRKGP
jgi:hypothetical protein